MKPPKRVFVPPKGDVTSALQIASEVGPAMRTSLFQATDESSAVQIFPAAA